MLASFLLQKRARPAFAPCLHFDIPSAWCSSPRHLHGSLPHLLTLPCVVATILHSQPAHLNLYSSALDVFLSLYGTQFSSYYVISYQFYFLSYSLPLRPLETMLPNSGIFVQFLSTFLGFWIVLEKINNCQKKKKKGRRKGRKEGRKIHLLLLLGHS